MFGNNFYTYSSDTDNKCFEDSLLRHFQNVEQGFNNLSPSEQHPMSLLYEKGLINTCNYSEKQNKFQWNDKDIAGYLYEVSNSVKCLNGIDLMDIHIVKHDTSNDYINSLGSNYSCKKSIGILYIVCLHKNAENNISTHAYWLNNELVKADRILLEIEQQNLQFRLPLTSTAGDISELLLSPIVTAKLLHTFFPLFVNYKYIDLFKEFVYPEILTIEDNGNLQNGINTTFLDSTGVRRSYNSLINGGSLTNFLIDNSYAAARGLLPTGNMGRFSYQDKPVIRPTNFYILASDKNIDEINKNAGYYYIENFLNNHVGFNINSGDFQCVCRGYSAQNGKPHKQFSRLLLKGNFFVLLSNIKAVFDNTVFSPIVAGVGAPSILVKKINN